jgi:beta-lactamase regulating signal transducer with metallopeptidase domain
MINADVLLTWRAWLDSGLTELAALLALVWLVDRLVVRRLHPGVRHALWLLVFVRLCLPPALAPQLPGAGVGLPVVPPIAAATAGPDAAAGTLGWLFAIWMAGAVALPIAWWTRSRRALGRLRPIGEADVARLTELAAPLQQTASLPPLPRVFVDTQADAPYVTGLWNPRLVLPPDWHGWPPRALSHALAHELMHLRRGDLWLEAGWMALVAGYWFHPLVHVARRRAHDARELCCDTALARTLGDDYRRAILELAAGWHGLTRTGAAPVRHGWGPLVTRLRLLESCATPMSPSARLASAMLLLAAAVVILPSHIRAAPDVPATTLTLDQLVDPGARQAAGLGSLHLRYELMRRTNLEGSPQ